MVLAASLLAAGLCLAATTANAVPITVSASIGGVPTGTNYENFDSLTLGGAGGATASGITVSFSPDGGAVQGSLDNKYAAPYLSSNNGTLFGDLNNGADGTTYLTSGLGNATLTFATGEKYLGLLWGSVDLENTLSFYDGATLVGSITGSDVTALANGDQGANGTFYVNINSPVAFDRVVATSTKYSFEFDNVAFDTGSVAVPEPGTIGMFLLGLALVGSGYWFRKRKPA